MGSSIKYAFSIGKKVDFIENVRFWLDPLPPPVSVRTLWMVHMVSSIWDSCRKKTKFNQNYPHCAPPHPIYIKKKDYERCSSGNPFFHDWDSRLQYLIYGDYRPGDAFWKFQVGVHRVVEGLRHALKPLPSSAQSKIYSIFYGGQFTGGNSPRTVTCACDFYSLVWKDSLTRSIHSLVLKIFQTREWKSHAPASHVITSIYEFSSVNKVTIYFPRLINIYFVIHHMTP